MDEYQELLKIEEYLTEKFLKVLNDDYFNEGFQVRIYNINKTLRLFAELGITKKSEVNKVKEYLKKREDLDEFIRLEMGYLDENLGFDLTVNRALTYSFNKGTRGETYILSFNHPSDIYIILGEILKLIYDTDRINKIFTTQAFLEKLYDFYVEWLVL